MAEDLAFATTLLVRDTCLCLHVQRAARALARCYDDAFRPLGITSGQFSLLMSLNRPEAAATGEVAAFLGMDRTTLTANVKPLERSGYLKVRAGETDRRHRALVLTEAGRAVLIAAVPIWEKSHAALEAKLQAANADRLRADLRALA